MLVVDSMAMTGLNLWLVLAGHDPHDSFVTDARQDVHCPCDTARMNLQQCRSGPVEWMLAAVRKRSYVGLCRVVDLALRRSGCEKLLDLEGSVGDETLRLLYEFMLAKV